MSLEQVIQILLHHEDDAKNVCRLHQRANHADGRSARVEMDDVFPSFLCAGALLEDGDARNHCVIRFSICLKHP